MSGNIGSISRQQSGYQVGEDQYGSGDNILSQLHDRVSATLAGSLDEQMAAAAGGGSMAQAVNPQDVVNFMSQIAQQPLPGMSCGTLV